MSFQRYLATAVLFACVCSGGMAGYAKENGAVLLNGAEPETLPQERPRPKPQRRFFTGRFVAVDAGAQTVEIENRQGEKFTCTITPETKVIVSEKDARLADVQVGMVGGVKLKDDGERAVMLKAMEAPRPGNGGPRRIFSGRVSAINYRERTIALTNVVGQNGTFTVGPDTIIRVNGAPGQLEDIRPEMQAGVHIVEEGKPIRELRAWMRPENKNNQPSN